ncbi:MAG: HNH endonuclease [Desulfuromonadales bacterium]|nr:HNH endonuclease [Desulfuromonadales bacterium]
MKRPSSSDQLRFLTGLQRILEEGSFVATYKFALLMALADFAIQAGQDEVDPEELDVFHLSENFISYYWRQALPYVTSRENDRKYLKMATGSQPVIFNQIVQLHALYHGSLPALRKNANDWHEIKALVADTIAKMPLWKLQVVGPDLVCVLYKQSRVGYQGRVLEFVPGALFNLRQHYDLVRGLVQGAWLRHVRRLNAASLGEIDLDEFLFGSERSTWPGLRQILRDVQGGSCLYCGRGVGDAGDIDHFIPWSRYPQDLGHNFVLAHATCNRSKSDLLASPAHLANWHKRNMVHGEHLSQRFSEKGILHDYLKTRHITNWAYAQAESVGAQLWYAKNDLRPIDPSWRGGWNG